MERVAEQIHWIEDEARKPTGLWGCWECGFEDSYVRDVDKDDQHVRVRLRECTRCGASWETEERRIARGSFFARAERRRYVHFRKTRYTTRQCLVCKERYLSGRYIEHTQESEAHRIRLEVRAKRKQDRERVYARMWARAKREVVQATRGTAVCKRCGERYPLTVKNPLKTHQGSSPEHRWVIQREARERKDRARQQARKGNHAKKS